VKKASWVLFLILLFPVAGSAQGTISLREAIELALKKNFLLRESTSRREAAEHSVAVARSRYFPRVSLEEAAAASNSPTRTFMMKLDQGRFEQSDFELNNLNNPSSHGDFRTSFQVDLPLFDAAVAQGRKLAEENLISYDYFLERQRQDVAFQVYGAWLDIFRAKQFVLVADQAVGTAAEHARLAQVRAATGTGLKSDELRARTYLSEAEQQKLTAENDLQVARWRLAQLAGEETGSSLDVSATFSPLAVNGDGNELMELALRQRSDLKSGETEVRKAATGVGLARSAYLPTLYGNASYQLNDRDIPFARDNDAWMAGVALRWDIFDGFRRSSEISRAGAMRTAAEVSLENQRREVVLQVKEALLRREEAARRLEVARRMVGDAEETVRLIRKRYENSLATMVELLDAQTTLDRTKAQLVENETGLARAAARVLHTSGVFLQEVLK